MELTPSQIRYLLAVYALHKDGAVRSADIAQALHVTRPSVHRMALQLSDMGLLVKEKYSSVGFTDTGRIIAEQYHCCFCCICTLLSQNLSLPHAPAEAGALAVLSSLSITKLRSVYNQTAAQLPSYGYHNKTCPLSAL